VKEVEMAEDSKPGNIGLWERILRSRTMRGILRIHVGFSLIRSWSMDVQVPRRTAIHPFDYLLYHRTGEEEPFEEWIGKRELLSP
jgi:hypothetical protein